MIVIVHLSFYVIKASNGILLGFFLFLNLYKHKLIWKICCTDSFKKFRLTICIFSSQAILQQRVQLLAGTQEGFFYGLNKIEWIQDSRFF